jgi:hypothetical protein
MYPDLINVIRINELSQKQYESFQKNITRVYAKNSLLRFKWPFKAFKPLIYETLFLNLKITFMIFDYEMVVRIRDTENGSTLKTYVQHKLIFYNNSEQRHNRFCITGHFIHIKMFPAVSVKWLSFILLAQSHLFLWLLHSYSKIKFIQAKSLLSIFSHLENNQLSLLSVCNPSTY